NLDGKEVVLTIKSTAVSAIGPKTKQGLEERGVMVELMPEKFSSAGLVGLLSSVKPTGKKLIIPRSGAANEFATEALTGLGMDVDEILLYYVRTSSITPIWREFSDLLRQQKVDAIVFTRASSVRSIYEMRGEVFGE